MLYLGLERSRKLTFFHHQKLFFNKKESFPKNFISIKMSHQKLNKIYNQPQNVLRNRNRPVRFLFILHRYRDGCDCSNRPYRLWSNQDLYALLILGLPFLWKQTLRGVDGLQFRLYFLSLPRVRNRWETVSQISPLNKPHPSNPPNHSLTINPKNIQPCQPQHF